METDFNLKYMDDFKNDVVISKFVIDIQEILNNTKNRKLDNSQEIISLLTKSRDLGNQIRERQDQLIDAKKLYEEKQSERTDLLSQLKLLIKHYDEQKWFINPKIRNQIESYDKVPVWNSLDLKINYEEGINFYSENTKSIRELYTELFQNTLQNQQEKNKSNRLLPEYNDLELKRKKLIKNNGHMREQVNKEYTPFKAIPEVVLKGNMLKNTSGGASEKYTRAIENYKKDITALEEEQKKLAFELSLLAEEKELQKNAVIKLNKNTKLDPEKSFIKIENNHKEYLKNNVIVFIDNSSKTESVREIATIPDKVSSFYTAKSTYLNHIIQPETTMEKLGKGTLAVLSGAAVGGLAYWAAPKSGIVDQIPLVSTVKNIAVAGVSVLLGGVVSKLVYDSLGDEDKKSLKVEDFNKEMEKAGFSDKKYNELSNRIVKLFHFRECLLLNKDNMREQFKEYLLQSQKKSLTKEQLDAAIEAHFLVELGKQFNESFQEIYDIHDKSIKGQINQNSFSKWIKNIFADPKKRNQFTQQMQIQFMTQCLHYFETQMTDPRFFAKYPMATATVTGLIAGSLALGLSMFILGGPIGFAAASIALLVTCITAITSYLIVTNDRIKYKRGTENREGLKNVIGKVGKEATRLSLLQKTVTDTKQEDIDEIEKLQKTNAESYLKFIGITKDTKVLIGSGSAWIREYAARYRHSLFIEDNLKKAIDSVIKVSETQISELQLAMLSRMTQVPEIDPIDKFIEHTQDYLQKNNDNNLGLKQKIKEQILEIVSVVPLGSNRPLHPGLVDFYTKILGGLAQDLHAVRKWTFFTKENPSEKCGLIKMTEKPSSEKLKKYINNQYITYGESLFYWHPLGKLEEIKLRQDKKWGDFTRELGLDNREYLSIIKSYTDHTPYGALKIIAKQCNDQLLNAKWEGKVLKGDENYRRNLGLGVYSADEKKQHRLTEANVDEYLSNSYAVLLSLMEKPENNEINGDYARSDAFQLYWTIVVKQLAELADLNNPQVDLKVRDKIISFTEKLGIEDAPAVFNSVLNQAVSFEAKDEQALYQGITMGLNYPIKVSTPKKLIESEMESEIATLSEHPIWLISDEQELGYENLETYVTKVENSINNTMALIKSMSTNALLLASGSFECYVSELDKKLQNFNLYVNRQTKGGNQDNVLKLLEEFNKNLAEYKAPHKNKEIVRYQTGNPYSFIQNKKASKEEVVATNNYVLGN
ncbi:MAG: hypothetical protein HYX60_10130 [Legionella longbeachae]|nr:hypothetical protein [Legionella longbeachae]